MVFVPFKDLLMIHGPRPQFVGPDGEILKPLAEIFTSAIQDYLALAVWDAAPRQSSSGGDVLC